MTPILRIAVTALALAASAASAVRGSTPVRLTLQETIRLANDSSLTAFRNENLFMAGYWEFRSFQAERLPSLSLSLTPASYSRYITSRYNYDENIDVYRAQQTYSAAAGLNFSQNFDLLGGTFYIESSLNYLRNMGGDAFNQFNSVPVRIGYSQQLIGFNAFKWDRRIEPVKYERVKKEYIYNQEEVSESAVRYFFQLALAQSEYKLARETLVSADTLYVIGERRFSIGSISQADLLTLKLDMVNARNSLDNARIELKRAMFSLTTFLGLDQDTELEVVVPGTPRTVEIPVDKALASSRDNNPTLLRHRQNILEAQETVSRRKVERMFNASLNASIGYNQVGSNLSGAYRDPLRQDLVSVSVSVPLIDWGVRKGRYNTARNNLEVAEIAARQDALSIEEDVIITVSDFNIRRQLVASASEAMDLADMAYDQTRKRFIIGKADLNSLTLSSNRRQDATKNYISALQNYWLSYYKLRKLTLYDFEYDMPISSKFDIDNRISLR